MSGVEYFDDTQAINPFMTQSSPIDLKIAQEEHTAIRQALESAGIKVIKVDPPANCQDGVYTANWALVRGDKAVLSSLPNARTAEQPYARAQLEMLGKQVTEAPFRFSGQGDALPCGNLLLMGNTYRTDPRMHQFVADTLGYDVVSLQTIPQLDSYGKPQINKFSGWPDSFFYDIDLAISVLKTNLIAWCPDAFVPESQAIIRQLPIQKIEVSLQEATEGFACNLVSTGETVIMSNNAPELKSQIEAHGLKTITPNISELSKGGGYIRCTTLTLNNS